MDAANVHRQSRTNEMTRQQLIGIACLQQAQKEKIKDGLKKSMRNIADRIFRDFKGNTPGELMNHIEHFHLWTQPLWLGKKSLYSFAWDVLNAKGVTFLGISK